MCIELTKANKPCLLAPKKLYCHLHIAKHTLHDLNKLHEEMKILKPDAVAYRLIDKPKPKLKKFISHKTESTLHLEILLDTERARTEELSNQLDEMKKQSDELKAQIELMKPDYDKYQIIVEYEKRRQIADQQNIPFESRDQAYHHLRWMRNQLAHSVK